jgi:hypothetical protein
MTQTASFLYALIITATIVFQLCVIAGAPWGRITQGGQNEGPLPTKNRIFAVFSILILAAMAASILSAAGMWPNWPTWTGWAALAMQVLSTVMNLITPSKAERKLWGPITFIMLLLALFVILS